MAQTPLSSATGYASADDVLVHCDWRPLAQLCADKETNETPLTRAQLLLDTNFLAAIRLASGIIETATLKGERYSPTDLAALTGSSLELLKWMVAKLTEGTLIQRRPNNGYTLPDAWQAITGVGGWLDQLAAGEKVFGFAETADAGLMKFGTIKEVDLIARQGAVTQARRLWGKRAQDWQ